jgi:hypothetical protein
MTHSASLRATGSAMLAWAALASASLPLRAASITRFTAATSFADVVAFGATANGPEAGRTSGLNSARLEQRPMQTDIGLAKAVSPRRWVVARLRQALCRMGASVCWSQPQPVAGAAGTLRGRQRRVRA